MSETPQWDLGFLILAKTDLWGLLDRHSGVALSLLKALFSGHVTGHRFLAEDCSMCVKGWIALLECPEGTDYATWMVQQVEQNFEGIQTEVLQANRCRENLPLLDYTLFYSPIERFILSVRTGDTPDTNPILERVSGWVLEWLWRYRGWEIEAFQREIGAVVAQEGS